MGGPDKVLTMEQIPLCPIKNSLFPLYLYYAVTYTLLNLDIIWWWYSVQDVTGVDGFPPSVRAEWIQTNINKKVKWGFKRIAEEGLWTLIFLKSNRCLFQKSPWISCWAMLKPFFFLFALTYTHSLFALQNPNMQLYARFFQLLFIFRNSITRLFSSTLFFVQITLAVWHGTGTTTITIFQQKTDKTLSRLFPRKS